MTRLRSVGVVSEYFDLWMGHHPSINFATPNAAPAAAAPISMTFNAPHHGFIPVILLLNQPKTKRQTKVITNEMLNACKGESTKK